MDIEDSVAPDGSPVAVYLAMPAHDALDLVVDQVPPGGSVLDLGCGVGRLANPLAATGRRVTGVDDHPAMLAHLDPAVDAVHADIAQLDLGCRFDVVVLASHLVNHPTAAPAFLRSCRRHVADGGVVLVERFHARLLDDLGERQGTVDGVGIRHEVHRTDGAWFSASAHYTVRSRTWTQRYQAVVLDDDALSSRLAAAGLVLDAWLDDDARWARAVPAPT